MSCIAKTCRPRAEQPTVTHGRQGPFRPRIHRDSS